MASDRSISTDVGLFAPFDLGGLRIANRFVMAPMTRNRAGLSDTPHGLTVQYYAQRASAGLIITEASQVSSQAKGYPGTPGIHTWAQIAGWKAVTHAVHAHGGKIFLQLWHVGRISHPSVQEDGALPVAPSAIKPDGALFTGKEALPFVEPRALGLDEMPGIVEQFSAGARNALQAGFDGVEIHGGHGYLLDQFLRDGSNRRTDAYGGTAERRMRLLLEVVEAVSGVWGRDRVGVRLSPMNAFNSMSDSDPQRHFDRFAAALSDCRIAYLHGAETPGVAFDWRAFRRAFDGIYVANGGYDLARAQAALGERHANLVAFGVGFLANPDFVERARRGGPYNAPIRATYYGGGTAGYTDYPALT